MDFSGIFTGWILGIASTIVSSTWTNARHKRQICEGLRVESQEVGVQLASVCFMVSKKIGRFDIELLKWLQQHSCKYQGHAPNKSLQDILNQFVNLPQSQIITLINEINSSSAAGTITIPKVEMPFIGNNLSLLNSVSPKLQRSILTALKYIRIVNDKIDHIDYWDKYTFTEPSCANYTSAVTNSVQCKEALLEAARRAADSLLEADGHLSNLQIFLGKS